MIKKVIKLTRIIQSKLYKDHTTYSKSAIIEVHVYWDNYLASTIDQSRSLLKTDEIYFICIQMVY